MSDQVKVNVVVGYDQSSLNNLRKAIDKQLSNIPLTISAKNLKALQLKLSVSQAEKAKVHKSIQNYFDGSDKQINVRLKVPNATKATQSIEQVASATQKVTRSTEEASAAQATFSSRLGRTSVRLAAYILPATAFFQIGRGIDFAAKSIVTYNRETTRLTQILRGNKQLANETARDILDLSVKYGQSAEELLQVGLTLAQAGDKFNAATGDLRKAVEGVARTNLAATFGDTKVVVEGLIATISQFNLTGKDTNRVLDVANELAKSFAIESKDLFRAVRAGGASFKIAGGNFEEFAAVVTSVRQTTRLSAEQIGTALNTISLRLQRGKTREFLQSLGIEIRDASGEALGLVAQLNQIAKFLGEKKADSTVFGQIAEEVSGIRQGSKFIPLIKDLVKDFDGLKNTTSVFSEALLKAQGSAGSLSKDTVLGLDRIDVTINKVKASFASFFSKLSEDRTFRSFISSLGQIAQGLASILEVARPLIPFLLLLGTAKLGQGLITGLPQFYRGLYAGPGPAGSSRGLDPGGLFSVTDDDGYYRGGGGGPGTQPPTGPRTPFGGGPRDPGSIGFYYTGINTKQPRPPKQPPQSPSTTGPNVEPPPSRPKLTGFAALPSPPGAVQIATAISQPKPTGFAALPRPVKVGSSAATATSNIGQQVTQQVAEVVKGNTATLNASQKIIAQQNKIASRLVYYGTKVISDAKPLVQQRLEPQQAQKLIYSGLGSGTPIKLDSIKEKFHLFERNTFASIYPKLAAKLDLPKRLGVASYREKALLQDIRYQDIAAGIGFRGLQPRHIRKIAKSMSGALPLDPISPLALGFRPLSPDVYNPLGRSDKRPKSIPTDPPLKDILSKGTLGPSGAVSQAILHLSQININVSNILRILVGLGRSMGNAGAIRDPRRLLSTQEGVRVPETALSTYVSSRGPLARYSRRSGSLKRQYLEINVPNAKRGTLLEGNGGPGSQYLTDGRRDRAGYLPGKPLVTPRQSIVTPVSAGQVRLLADAFRIAQTDVIKKLGPNFPRSTAPRIGRFDNQYFAGYQYRRSSLGARSRPLALPYYPSSDKVSTSYSSGNTDAVAFTSEQKTLIRRQRENALRVKNDETRLQNRLKLQRSTGFIGPVSSIKSDTSVEDFSKKVSARKGIAPKGFSEGGIPFYSGLPLSSFKRIYEGARSAVTNVRNALYPPNPNIKPLIPDKYKTASGQGGFASAGKTLSKIKNTIQYYMNTVAIGASQGYVKSIQQGGSTTGGMAIGAISSLFPNLGNQAGKALSNAKSAFKKQKTLNTATRLPFAPPVLSSSKIQKLSDNDLQAAITKELAAENAYAKKRESRIQNLVKSIDKHAAVIDKYNAREDKTVQPNKTQLESDRILKNQTARLLEEEQKLQRKAKKRIELQQEQNRRASDKIKAAQPKPREISADVLSGEAGTIQHRSKLSARGGGLILGASLGYALGNAPGAVLGGIAGAGIDMGAGQAALSIGKGVGRGAQYLYNNAPPYVAAAGKFAGDKSSRIGRNISNFFLPTSTMLSDYVPTNLDVLNNAKRFNSLVNQREILSNRLSRVQSAKEKLSESGKLSTPRQRLLDQANESYASSLQNIDKELGGKEFGNIGKLGQQARRQQFFFDNEQKKDVAAQIEQNQNRQRQLKSNIGQLYGQYIDPQTRQVRDESTITKLDKTIDDQKKELSQITNKTLPSLNRKYLLLDEATSNYTKELDASRFSMANVNKSIKTKLVTGINSFNRSVQKAADFVTGTVRAPAGANPSQIQAAQQEQVQRRARRRGALGLIGVTIAAQVANQIASKYFESAGSRKVTDSDNELLLRKDYEDIIRQNVSDKTSGNVISNAANFGATGAFLGGPFGALIGAAGGAALGYLSSPDADREINKARLSTFINTSKITPYSNPQTDQQKKANDLVTQRFRLAQEQYKTYNDEIILNQARPDNLLFLADYAFSGDNNILADFGLQGRKKQVSAFRSKDRGLARELDQGQLSVRNTSLLTPDSTGKIDVDRFFGSFNQAQTNIYYKRLTEVSNQISEDQKDLLNSNISQTVNTFIEEYQGSREKFDQIFKRITKEDVSKLRASNPNLTEVQAKSNLVIAKTSELRNLYLENQIQQLLVADGELKKQLGSKDSNIAKRAREQLAQYIVQEGVVFDAGFSNNPDKAIIKINEIVDKAQSAADSDKLGQSLEIFTDTFSRQITRLNEKARDLSQNLLVDALQVLDAKVNLQLLTGSGGARQIDTSQISQIALNQRDQQLTARDGSVSLFANDTREVTGSLISYDRVLGKEVDLADTIGAQRFISASLRKNTVDLNIEGQNRKITLGDLAATSDDEDLSTIQNFSQYFADAIRNAGQGDFAPKRDIDAIRAAEKLVLGIRKNIVDDPSLSNSQERQSIVLLEKYTSVLADSIENDKTGQALQTFKSNPDAYINQIINSKDILDQFNKSLQKVNQEIQKLNIQFQTETTIRQKAAEIASTQLQFNLEGLQRGVGLGNITREERVIESIDLAKKIEESIDPQGLSRQVQGFGKSIERIKKLNLLAESGNKQAILDRAKAELELSTERSLVQRDLKKLAQSAQLLNRAFSDLVQKTNTQIGSIQKFGELDFKSTNQYFRTIPGLSNLTNPLADEGITNTSQLFNLAKTDRSRFDDIVNKLGPAFSGNYILKDANELKKNPEDTLTNGLINRDAYGLITAIRALYNLQRNSAGSTLTNKIIDNLKIAEGLSENISNIQSVQLKIQSQILDELRKLTGSGPANIVKDNTNKENKNNLLKNMLDVGSAVFDNGFNFIKDKISIDPKKQDAIDMLTNTRNNMGTAFKNIGLNLNDPYQDELSETVLYDKSSKNDGVFSKLYYNIFGASNLGNKDQNNNKLPFNNETDNKINLGYVQRVYDKTYKDHKVDAKSVMRKVYNYKNNDQSDVMKKVYDDKSDVMSKVYNYRNDDKSDVKSIMSKVYQNVDRIRLEYGLSKTTERFNTRPNEERYESPINERQNRTMSEDSSSRINGLDNLTKSMNNLTEAIASMHNKTNDDTTHNVNIETSGNFNIMGMTGVSQEVAAAAVVYKFIESVALQLSDGDATQSGIKQVFNQALVGLKQTIYMA